MDWKQYMAFADGHFKKVYAVYFGTYTKGKSKGIYRSLFDVVTGKLGEPELWRGDDEPLVPRDSSEP